MYILNECTFKRVNVNYFTEAECVLLKVKQDKGSVLICALYRPPDTCVSTFIQELDKFVSQIQNENTKCIMLGDINIDILDTNRSFNYVNVMEGSGFLPCIKDISTRSTINSDTLIDHIYYNMHGTYCNAGVIEVDISDHKPVFCIIKGGKAEKCCTTLSEGYYNLCEENIDQFKKKISESDFSQVYNSNDVNEAYTNFVKIIEQASQDMYIVGKKNCKKNIKKPWITKSILCSILKKNKMYKKFCKQPFNVELERCYKKYKNILQSVINEAEKLYFNNKFMMANNSSKKTWSVINEVLNKKKGNESGMRNELKLDGYNESINDPLEICNHLNNYFVNVGKEVSESIKLDGSEKSFDMYLGNPHINSFYATPVDKYEVEKLIDNLKENKAYGFDNIHPKFLKVSKEIISEPLAYIINKSITEGIVPDNLKIAKIIPLFKSGDATSPNNYRPVSILPVISKIFEKAMYKRLIKYLDSNNFFYKFQYGFREHHDTKLAIAELINSLEHDLDKGNTSLGVFIDLKKAFDTVNHNILLKKIYHYGV